MRKQSASEFTAATFIGLTCICAAAAPAIPTPESVCQTPHRMESWVSSILNPTHSRELIPATRLDHQWPPAHPLATPALHGAPKGADAPKGAGAPNEPVF